MECLQVLLIGLAGMLMTLGGQIGPYMVVPPNVAPVFRNFLSRQQRME